MWGSGGEGWDDVVEIAPVVGLDGFWSDGDAADGDAYLDDGWDDDGPLLAEGLGRVMHPDHAGADPEALEDALDDLMASMSPAESLGVAGALRQIGAGASRALGDPATTAVLRATLPAVTGAAGTVVGGPAGTAVGGALGHAVARSLPAPPTAPPTARPPGGSSPRPVPPPALAGGSAAAARGLVLTQNRRVLEALMALALGPHGRPSVGGVPVPAVLSMLSSILGRAAEDADELYVDGGAGPDDADDLEPLLYGSPEGRADALYRRLVGAADDALAEAWESGPEWGDDGW